MRAGKQLIAGTAFAAMVSFSPLAAAQVNSEGSMAVGGATVSVGGGTALLTLPDVDFTLLTIFSTTVGKLTNSEIDDEIGYNVNGTINIPTSGPANAIGVNGFFARIEDGSTLTCGNGCGWMSIIDSPVVNQQTVAALGGNTARFVTGHDVDQWGVSVEARRHLGAARTSTVALGADVRGIDQDLDIAGSLSTGTASMQYNEELDTRYYGAYAAYEKRGSVVPFIANILANLGLQSSFRAWGGVYHAEADYDGRFTESGAAIPALVALGTRRLSLSDDDIAFIGGVTLQTSKKLGKRATLTLKSDYEYYSWVPEMQYNDRDTPLAMGNPGLVNGTRIDDDDAFSARTSLRLTVKLGPDNIQ